jgi:lipopolysaccharide/colanic/teichoic acid biosynthesis glycosyltransferase
MTFKRVFDIAASLLAMLVLFPVVLLTSIGILLTMPGPVLFRQKRIGYKGQIFTIYKFRSMRVNKLKVSITLSSDNRITPFGRFMRHTKLDELPQLWNILKGDMSVVGPRPDVPGYSDQLTGEGKLIWTVRPGLSGLDSVTYPDEESILDQQENPQKYYDEVLWPEKVKINVWYVKHHSFLLDMKIIFKTLFRMWSRKKFIEKVN